MSQHEPPVSNIDGAGDNADSGTGVAVKGGAGASTGNNVLEYVLLSCGLLLVVFALYWSGLFGGFLLDDIPNLAILSQLPTNPIWSDFWYLANSGSAGVLGRPLSLLSFLLQYQAWPDPFTFKLVNLLLHLVNGSLLACMCVLLARQQQRAQISMFGVLLICFIWLAHPLQVSTVMYVVQRMTELSSLFILLGITLYLLGRQQLIKHQPRRGFGLILVGVLICGALAVFSKESGVLLLPYLAVLEFTLLTKSDDSHLLVICRRYLVYLPLCIGVLGFLLYLPTVLQGYELKAFTLTQRLLTQPAVLLSYLINFALLLPNYFGLFHDDFPISGGLMSPLWTLPAIVGVLALLLVAILKRRQWPVFSFAVLWFFVGHSLESTLLPLEMYFEHRNYLPLIGPVFAIVVLLQTAMQAGSENLRRPVAGLLLLLLGWMCVLTVQQSRLWGEPLRLAHASVEAHPASIRAQSNLVEALSNSGQFEAAYAYHRSVIDNSSASITDYIRWLEFRCLLPNVDLPDSSVLVQQARSAVHDNSAVALLNNLTFGIIQNRCAAASIEQLQIVLTNLLLNPAFRVNHPDLLQLQGFLAASAGDFRSAARLAADSFELRADVRVALYRTSWLLRAGEVDVARQELQLLGQAYGGAIAASSDLTNRYQLLRQQLQL